MSLNTSGQDHSRKWDLDSCIRYAKANNISIKKADIKLRVENLNLKLAKLNTIPSVNFSATQATQFGRSINPITNSFTNINLLSDNFQLGGSLMLYNSGRLRNLIEAELNNDSAVSLEIQKLSDEISLKILNSYLQVLAAKQQISLYNLEILQTQEQIKITQQRFDAGTTGEIDIIRLKSKQASDSSNYYDAKLSYNNAILSLKALLNIDPSLPFNLELPSLSNLNFEPLSDFEPNIIYQHALENQAQQKITSYQIASEKYNLLASKGTLYPSLTFNYNITSVFSNYIENQPFKNWWTGFGNQFNNNFGQQFQLTLNIPIFNNGHNKIAYEQDKLNLENLFLEQTDENIQLKQAIYQAYSNTTGAHEKLNVGITILDQANKTYDLSLHRYQIGNLSTIDLITTQNDLLKAKEQQLSNQFDYFFKIKILEFYNTGTFK